jgi:WD40 repeat protein
MGTTLQNRLQHDPTGEELRSRAPRAFISYARSDGEQFAGQLRARLLREEPEITLWQDRSSLEGGIGWWKQIADALSSVQFLVLVMTPEATRSPVVQQEWRLARQQGVCVYPVKGAPDAEPHFDTLPRWMRKTHFFDLEREWQTFVNYLKSPCRANRIPFMAPPLPDKFVARLATSDPVREALTFRAGGAVALTTSLQGAGGLGKTTLAIALCHDEEIIETYDDGILWVSLGKEPRIVDELAKMYVALTGKRPGFIDEEDAAYHLAQELQDKHCLIVIDDVWNARHLMPFLREGSGCTRLITTRLANVVTTGTSFRVDEMMADEAIALLMGRLPVVSAEYPTLNVLARRLGEWPLLLELANAQLRRRIDKGDDLRGALDYLNRRLDKQGIVAFDQRHATQRQEAIARTIELSLETLEPTEREATVKLAVFPEDTSIPLELVQALWERDELEAEELAALLDDISLAKLDVQAGTLQLHDVIRGYFGTQLREPTAVHSRAADLVSASTGAAASFAWRWRAYHLLRADRRGELRNELVTFGSLIAKLVATDINTVIADFDNFADDPDLQLILDAIKLSVPVLAADQLQAPGQLLGRLSTIEDTPTLHRFRNSIESWEGSAWLRPYTSVLTGAGGPLLATLVGHEGPVVDIALTQSGTRAVSTSTDGTLRIWDWRHSHCVRVLVGHKDRVSAVAIVRDSVVVSASNDGTIRTWDLYTGELLATIEAGGERLSRMVALSTEPRTVTMVCGARILSWQIGTPWAPRRIGEHAEQIRAIASLPSGGILTAADDRCLGLWQTPATSAGQLCKGHTAPVAAMAVGTDEAALVCTDGTISLWGTTPGLQKQYDIESLAFRVTCAAMLPRSRLLVGSEDASLRVLDLKTGNTEQVLRGHTAAINAVCVSNDGHVVISISDDHSLRVWDLLRGSSKRKRGAHAGPVHALTFSPDSRFAFSTFDFAELVCWDVESGTVSNTVRGSEAWKVDMSPSETLVVLGLVGKTLHCWPLDNAGLGVIYQRDGSIRAVHYSVDDRRTILIDTRGAIGVWDRAPPSRLMTLPVRDDLFTQCLLGAQGAHLALIAHSGELQVWDLRSANAMSFGRIETPVIAMSPDGTRLAYVLPEGKLAVLETKTSNEIVIGAHDAARAVTFSGTGDLLASCGNDNTLRLWEIGSRTQLAAFTFESVPSTCAVSPDGNTVVAGDALGCVHFFRVHRASNIAA